MCERERKTKAKSGSAARRTKQLKYSAVERGGERGPRVLSLLSSLSSSPCSRLAGLLLSHRAFVRSFVHVSPYL